MELLAEHENKGKGPLVQRGLLRSDWGIVCETADLLIFIK